MGLETARFAPPRRAALGRLEVYEREARQFDLAVRNTRVLARDVLRLVRRDGGSDHGLAEAIRVLADAVRSRGEDDERERTAATRRLALEAARRSTSVLEHRRDLATSAIVSQIRSTAADLVRAADLDAGSPEASHLASTEEILVTEREGLPPR